jgi:hypothetical protein
VAFLLLQQLLLWWQGFLLLQLPQQGLLLMLLLLLLLLLLLVWSVLFPGEPWPGWCLLLLLPLQVQRWQLPLPQPASHHCRLARPVAPRAAPLLAAAGALMQP